VKLLPARLRGAPEQGVYVVIGVLAVVVLFVVGFIVKNDKPAKVDFVLFSAATSLIWVILVSLLLGLIGGIALARLGPLARTSSSLSGPGAAHDPDGGAPGGVP
jgi:uncharacterized integral membrane protein